MENGTNKTTSSTSRQARSKKVVIIGRPNVGKSSLFNRIIGRRQAIVHDAAGTTRDLVSETVSINNKSFELYDTAGYLTDKSAPFSVESLAKINEAIGFADLLIFVVDGNIAPTNEELRIADIIRKSEKEMLLAVNKLDNTKDHAELDSYLRFGFKQIFPVSAIHNLGIQELLRSILRCTKPEARSQKPEAIATRIAILGRPNVGKSSILNALTKKERAIVSSIPGTTRDVVTEIIHLPMSLREGEADVAISMDSYVEKTKVLPPQNDNGGIRDNKKSTDLILRISDTAGARKPGKIGMAAKKGEPVEKYSWLRTQREIEESDIVLVVIDASDKIAAQDLHIAGQAKELGKGIILVINKWDLVKDVTQEKFLDRLRREFNFMIWVPAIFISAKTGRNIEEILNIIKTVAENQKRKIPTSKLNRILEDFMLDNTPKGTKNTRPKIFFAAQTNVVPPTISITAKHYAFIHFAWRRALENELRRHYDFSGTPVRVIFKDK